MARMGGADSSSFSSRTSSSNSSSVFQNYPLISALLAFALAQSTKFFATWYLFHPCETLYTPGLAMGFRFSFLIFQRKDGDLYGFGVALSVEVCFLSFFSFGFLEAIMVKRLILANGHWSVDRVERSRSNGLIRLPSLFLFYLWRGRRVLIIHYNCKIQPFSPL